MLRSLTTTNPLLPLLFLSPPPTLQISIPETSKQSSLELKLERRERNILRAKTRNFNVDVEVDEEDDLDERLDRFNRQVARTGLYWECRRRRFYENAREEKKRKQREAALLRRRRRQHKHKEKSPIENDDAKDELWAFSDEYFKELIGDEEVSNEELESYFQDVDGEGTWQLL